jgi:VanZ family protein
VLKISLVRNAYYALALGWAVVILIGTLLPANALPPTPKWDFLTFDSLVHAVLFGTQLFLLLLALRKDPSLSLTPRLVTGAFVTVVVFGGLVEVLQGAMALGRQLDPVDALSNAIGCVLGLFTWLLLRARF